MEDAVEEAVEAEVEVVVEVAVVVVVEVAVVVVVAKVEEVVTVEVVNHNHMDILLDQHILEATTAVLVLLRFNQYQHHMQDLLILYRQ